MSLKQVQQIYIYIYYIYIRIYIYIRAVDPVKQGGPLPAINGVTVYKTPMNGLINYSKCGYFTPGNKWSYGPL